MFSRLFVALSLLALTNVAFAKNLQDFINEPEVVGKARLSVLFWDIYDAQLFASKGEFSSKQPFALELKYLRDFEGKEIASRSVDEIRGLGMTDEVKLAKWYQEMKDLFPDVSEGESITGIVDTNGLSHFYLNEEPLGVIQDKEFGQWFFRIWLGEKTSEPKMREQLLGLVQ